MKILWFANNACGSIRRQQGKTTMGGWLISLEDEIKKYQDVELSVCFLSPFDEVDFVYDNIHYYPIRRRSKTFIKRIVERYESPYAFEQRMLPKLLNVVKLVSPDLIHIHGTEECYGLIQNSIKGIPVVFSIQGLIAPYTEKYFSGLPMAEMKRYEPLVKRCMKVSFLNDYKSFRYRSTRELLFLNKAHYIIGRTQFDHSTPLLCNPKVKLFQGEEILRSEFYKVSWNKKAFGCPLKIVSTISGGIYKGFETALHASWLLKKYARFVFEWHIIGYDCNSEWVSYAERYKGMKSHSSGLIFHGRMQASEMIELMLSSDLFVQVSHIENSPNSLCEAMMLGMPIIASFAGGTSSMLKDGEEGVLVQDGDPYTLAGVIVNMHSDFASAKTMGEKARVRAQRRHDPSTVAHTVKRIYETILKTEADGSKDEAN